MRWYDIKIKGKDNDNKSQEVRFRSQQIYPRYFNPTPLNIRFEYSTHTTGNGADTRAINLNLFIYSQSLATFKELAKLNKKTLEFYAGWDVESKFFQSLGYTRKRENQLIFRGGVAGVTGNFVRNDSWIMLSCSSSENRDALGDFKWIVTITQNDHLFGNSSDTRSTRFGSSTTNTIYDAILNVVSNLDMELRIHPKIKNLTHQQPTTIKIKYSTFKELQEQIVDKFGVWLELYEDKGVCYALPTQQEKYDLIIKNAQNSDMMKRIVAKQNARNFGRNIFVIQKLVDETDKDYGKMGGSVSQDAIPIEYAELLEQPMLVGFSEGYQVKTILRPDLKLNSTIKLKGVTPAMGGLFSSSRGYVGDEVNNRQFSQSEFNKYLTLEGKFKVVNIKHRGNFYGGGVNDWATEMIVLPYDVAKKKELELKARK